MLTESGPGGAGPSEARGGEGQGACLARGSPSLTASAGLGLRPSGPPAIESGAPRLASEPGPAARPSAVEVGSHRG